MEIILIALALLLIINLAALLAAVRIYRAAMQEEANPTAQAGRVTTKDLGGTGPWRPGTDK